MTHRDAVNQAHDERHPFCFLVIAANYIAITPYYLERLPK